MARTLPCRDQRRKRFHGFFERRIEIIPVRLVEIDIISLQPPQRIIHRRRDPGFRETAFCPAHLHAAFGRNDYFAPVPTPRQPVADDGFGFARPYVRAEIAYRNPRYRSHSGRLRPAIQNFEAGRRVQAPAEHIAAEHDRRQRDAGFSSCFLIKCQILRVRFYRAPCLPRSLRGRASDCLH